MTDMEKISAALEGALRLIPELVAEIERMRALANDAAESATQHQTELLRLRTELANVNNEFGSQTADWPDARKRVAELKQESNNRWRNAQQLRTVLVDVEYALTKARIWGGMEWHFNPLHPMHYTPILERVQKVLRQP